MMSDYTEDELRMYSAWSDYRSEYGASGDAAYDMFIDGWDAARDDWYPELIALMDMPKHWLAGYEAQKGTLDIGGVMR